MERPRPLEPRQTVPLVERERDWEAASALEELSISSLAGGNTMPYKTAQKHTEEVARVRVVRHETCEVPGII